MRIFTKWRLNCTEAYPMSYAYPYTPISSKMQKRVQTMQSNDIKNVYTPKSTMQAPILVDTDAVNYNTFDTECQVKEYAAAMRQAARLRKYDVLALRGQGKNKKADNVQSCAAYILYKEKETQDGEFLQKIDQMYLCKDRYCMFCAGVKAGKNLRILSQAFQRLGVNDNNIRYRFITLTVPNVGIKHLRGQISAMTSAFNSLNARYKKAGMWNGFYRSLEITYNADTEEYHPHLHVIADGKYIPLTTLSAHWYTACTHHGIKNIPESMRSKGILNVDIRAVLKPWELCKYVVKPDTLTYAAVYDLIDTEALKGLRDNASGGTLKKVVADIKKEIKNANADQKEVFAMAKYIRDIAYYWTGTEYERR